MGWTPNTHLLNEWMMNQKAQSDPKHTPCLWKARRGFLTSTEHVFVSVTRQLGKWAPAAVASLRTRLPVGGASRHRDERGKAQLCCGLGRPAALRRRQ